MRPQGLSLHSLSQPRRELHSACRAPHCLRARPHIQPLGDRLRPVLATTGSTHESLRWPAATACAVPEQVPAGLHGNAIPNGRLERISRVAVAPACRWIQCAHRTRELGTASRRQRSCPPFMLCCRRLHLLSSRDGHHHGIEFIRVAGGLCGSAQVLRNHACVCVCVSSVPASARLRVQIACVRASVSATQSVCPHSTPQSHRPVFLCGDSGRCRTLPSMWCIPSDLVWPR